MDSGINELLQRYGLGATARQIFLVAFDRFSDSSLDFFIYTFTHTTTWARYHDVMQDVLLRLAAIIEAHGAEVAFPTRTLHPAPGAMAEAGAAQSGASASSE